MKKINSIHFGTAFLKWAALFTVIIPLLCFGGGLFIENQVLSKIGLLSFCIGILILIIFTIILLVEFRQDRYLNSFYKENLDIKRALDNNMYECQSCGSRLVKAEDNYCSVCGMVFRKD